MPRLSPLHVAWACAALAASTITFAAPGIWRCGNNSYSDIPCEGGLPFSPNAPPSAQQREQADEATRKDQAAASRMQRERLQLESTAARNATVIGPAKSEPAPAASKSKASKPSNKRKKTGGPDDGTFVASSGKPEKEPKKPKRAAD